MSSIPNSDQFKNERMILLKEISGNPDYDIFALVDRLAIPRANLENYMRSFFKTMAQFTDSDDNLDPTTYGDIEAIINNGVSTEFGILDDRDVDNLYYVYQKYRKLDPTLYTEADQIRSTRVFNSPPNTITTNQQQPNVTAVAHSSSNPIPNVGGGVTEYEAVPPPTVQNQNISERVRSGFLTAKEPPDFNVERLNRGYNFDYLAKLSRVGLMRHVLENLSHGPNTPAIESFMPIYELNQDDLMVSPEILRMTLIKHFGDKTGDNAAVAFNSYIGYLKPTEYYGVKKITGGRMLDGMFPNGVPQGGVVVGGMTGGAIPFPNNPNPSIFGSQQQSGPQFQDPWNTYYHAEGVLPFGMDIRTPDAKRLIHEWEADKKRKKKAEDEMNAMMTRANQKMQFQMANMFDQGKIQQNNGGFGADFMQNLVMMSMISMVTSGKANILPYTDENGKMQLKVEGSPAGALTDMQSHADPNALGIRDIFGLMKEMNDKVFEKQAEATNARIEAMEKYALGDKKDPIMVVGETVKALRDVIPGFDERFQGGGGGNQADPLEMARIHLERDKFTYDKERTDKLIDHKYELERQREEYEREDSIEANKTRRQTMKLMTNSVVSILPTVLQLVLALMAKRNPDLAPVASMMGGGGGGGGLGGGLGGLLGNLMKAFGSGGGGDNEDEDEDEDEEGDEGPGGGVGDVLGSLFGGGNKTKRGGYDDSNDTGGGQLGGAGGMDITQMLNSAMNLAKDITSGAGGGSRRMRRQVPSQQYDDDDYEGEGEGEEDYNPRYRDSGGVAGVRPSFTEVVTGNPRASIPKPVIINPNSQPVMDDNNIYSSIEKENEKRAPITEDTEEQRVPGLGEVNIATEAPRPRKFSNDGNVVTLPRYQDQFKLKVKKGTSRTMSVDEIAGNVPPPQHVVDQLSPEEEGGISSIPSPRNPRVIVEQQEEEMVVGEEEGDNEDDDEEVVEEEEEYSTYTTDDFNDYSDDELREAVNKGKMAVDSEESYLKGALDQLKRRTAAGGVPKRRR